MAYLDIYSANAQKTISLLGGVFNSAVTADLVAAGTAYLDAGGSEADLYGVLMTYYGTNGGSAFANFASTASDADFATALVTQLVGASTVSAATQTAWASAIASALPAFASRGEAMTALMNLINSYTGTGDELATLHDAIANRAEVGAYYAQTAAGATFSSLSQLSAPVASVTESASSVTSAEANIPGSTFTLTTASTDSFTGTAANDTLDASTIDTMQTSDSIIDSSSTDNDTLNALVSGNSAAPTLVGVESINLTGKYGTVGMSMANATGVKTLTMDSSIASGTATVTNAKATNIVSSTNVTSLTVTDASNATGSNITANEATSVTVTDGNSSSAETFTVTMVKAGTLTMDGSNANGTNTFTATLASGSNTVTATGGSGTDSFTLNLNGGTTTLTGNTANETLNIQSSGAANTVNATATVATSTGTIVVTGDQSLTLKDTAASFDGVTFTDNTTAGTTTVKMTDPGAVAADLSKIGADVIELLATANNTAALKFANGANVMIDDGTAAIKIQGKATTDVLNVVANSSTVRIADGGTDFATINLSADKATTVYATMDSSATKLVLSGSNNITLDGSTTVKSVEASGMSGVLTMTYDNTSDVTTVTGGTGNDVFNMVTPSAAVTLDGGSGTDTIKLGSGALDFSGIAASVVTGINKFDTNNQALTLTQKQLFTDGNDFTVTNTNATNTGNALNLTIDSSVGSTVADLSHVVFSYGASGGATGFTITGSSSADTITTSTLSDTVAGGAGKDTITLTGTSADTLKYVEAGTTAVDTITGFQAGTDIVSVTKGNITNGAGTDTLSTVGGADIAVAIAAGSLTAATVAVDTAVTAADATNLLFLSNTSATSFATAMGTAAVTDTSGPSTAGLTIAASHGEAVLATWYDSTNSQAVVGYILDTDASGTALTSADTFVEIARVGMTSSDYTSAHMVASLSVF